MVGILILSSQQRWLVLRVLAVLGLVCNLESTFVVGLCAKVVRGKKRWVLFPPDVPKSVVRSPTKLFAQTCATTASCATEAEHTGLTAIAPSQCCRSLLIASHTRATSSSASVAGDKGAEEENPTQRRRQTLRARARARRRRPRDSYILLCVVV